MFPNNPNMLLSFNEPQTLVCPFILTKYSLFPLLSFAMYILVVDKTFSCVPFQCLFFLLFYEKIDQQKGERQREIKDFNCRTYTMKILAPLFKFLKFATSRKRIRYPSPWDNGRGDEQVTGTVVWLGASQLSSANSEDIDNMGLQLPDD